MKLLLILLIFFSFLLAISFASIRFTNFQCDSYDDSLVTFTECDLKVLRRNVVGLNMYAKVHNLPIPKAFFNVALLKKASGYRPFLYNVTVDVCSFFKNRKRMPLLDIIFTMLTTSSNMNHSCPYDHDIIIRNWVLEVGMFDKLPLPAGEYITEIKAGIKKNQWKGEVRVYYLISDNL